jgi:hypothetical protein
VVQHTTPAWKKQLPEKQGTSAKRGWYLKKQKSRFVMSVEYSETMHPAKKTTSCAADHCMAIFSMHAPDPFDFIPENYSIL